MIRKCGKNLSILIPITGLLVLVERCVRAATPTGSRADVLAESREAKKISGSMASFEQGTLKVALLEEL